MYYQCIRDKFPELPLILFNEVGNELEKNNRELFRSVVTKSIRQQILNREMLSVLQGNDKKVSGENTVEQILTIDELISMLSKWSLPETGQVIPIAC